MKRKVLIIMLALLLTATMASCTSADSQETNDVVNDKVTEATTSEKTEKETATEKETEAKTEKETEKETEEKTEKETEKETEEKTEKPTEKVTQQATKNNSSSSNSNSQTNDVVVQGDDVFVNGQGLDIGMEINDSIINAIGTPLQTMSAPSCHYDGEDTLYIYNGFTLYVYKNGSSNILYIVEITSSSYPTNKGAKVGMTKEEVINLHGKPTQENDLLIKYTSGGITTQFSLEGGKVSMIEIM